MRLSEIDQALREPKEQSYRMRVKNADLDGPTIGRLRHKVTESFKEQLEFGVPTSWHDPFWPRSEDVRARRQLQGA